VTEVKICGITGTKDALVAAQCGAAALGFIFYPSSPRYIRPKDAKKIISLLPDKLVSVGVFVNEKPENAKEIMEDCGLDMIQLHGDETPEYCRQFPASIVIKAVELKNTDDLNRALDYDVAAMLVDSRHGNLYGGTGKTSNWELSGLLKNKKPLILSGGLNVENVAEAMRTVEPVALDINSGVEASPGKKDHKKLVRIFDIIRTFNTKHEKAQLIFKKREI
jgi:phosphoribosylanthranilate isomerase